MSERAQELVAIIVAVCAFLYASSMDYEDAVSDRDVYCEQVRSNAWPDFKPEADCKEE